MGAREKRTKPEEAVLTVLDVIQETPDVRTFRLDNSDGVIPFDLPGTFAKVCLSTDDGDVWRSFTISSSPHDARQIDLTIKLNPDGQVSRYLFENIEARGAIRIKGAHGGFFFDPDRHSEPLVLISAGSGITPMMSIARTLCATGRDLSCTFLYGARAEADIIFREECERLARDHEWFRYVVTLSQPGEAWTGECGRIHPERVASLIEDPGACRCFLCGPNEFMQTLQEALCELGVPEDRIHTEQFDATKALQAVM